MWPWPDGLRARFDHLGPHHTLALSAPAWPRPAWYDRASMARPELAAKDRVFDEQARGTGREPNTLAAERAARLASALVENVGKVLQGKREAVELSVTCLLARGHLL